MLSAVSKSKNVTHVVRDERTRCEKKRYANLCELLNPVGHQPRIFKDAPDILQPASKRDDERSGRRCELTSHAVAKQKKIDAQTSTSSIALRKRQMRLATTSNLQGACDLGSQQRTAVTRRIAMTEARVLAQTTTPSLPENAKRRVKSIQFC